MSVVMKLFREVTYVTGLVTNVICFISTCRRPICTKLNMVVAYQERLLTSPNPFITIPTWSPGQACQGGDLWEEAQNANA